MLLCRDVSASFLLLYLGGCASIAPQPLAPDAIDIPVAWSDAPTTSLTATPLNLWWHRFHDPLLAGLIHTAQTRNTSIRSAQAALRQARALRDVAAAGLSPTLGGSASAQHGTAGGDSTGNRFNVDLNASWDPDVFGVRRKGLEASEAAALASAATLDDVQLAIVVEVALNYIALRGTQARLVIADDNLASQLETLQISQWRLQAGLITSLETEQGRSLMEQTRAQLPALQTSIRQTRHVLALLTGQAPAALDLSLARVGAVPVADDDLLLAIPAQTLRQRADVRAAEYQVTAELARLGQAEAARAPLFQLSGSLGLNAPTLGKLAQSSSVISSLLASAAMPILDGGALRAQERAQASALQIAQISYEATVLGALRDVEDALIALRGDRERLLRLQQASDAAGNAALLARQRFGSGLVDFQTVLETQRTQLNTQDSVASARADVAADYVRLYKALGGGWQADTIALPAPAPATGNS